MCLRTKYQAVACLEWMKKPTFLQILAGLLGCAVWYTRPKLSWNSGNLVYILFISPLSIRFDILHGARQWYCTKRLHWFTNSHACYWRTIFREILVSGEFGKDIPYCTTHWGLFYEHGLNCGMELLTYSQTSTMQPLTFRNDYVTGPVYQFSFWTEMCVISPLSSHDVITMNTRHPTRLNLMWPCVYSPT